MMDNASFLVKVILVVFLVNSVFPSYSRKTNKHHKVSSLQTVLNDDDEENLLVKRKLHKLRILNRKATKRLADLNEYTKFQNDYLSHILRVRVPGTTGHHAVKTFIKNTLEKYGWTVEMDEFVSKTPIGKKKFTNIIGTLFPEADKRLVLAAHYDSKLMPPVNDQYFLGATDSAVPCAMLLDFAKLLSDGSKGVDNKTVEESPTLIFLDGEEAFEEWSDTDSLYGSRHLAEKLSQKPHHRRSLAARSVNMLDAIEAFLLFDLLGAKNPQFFDIYPATSELYSKMQDIEARLHVSGKIGNKYRYFQGKPNDYFEVEDDHIPFLHKGVPILHLISVPFPTVWHKLSDNVSALDEDTIVNLLHIFRQFLVEYFDLR